MHARYRSLTAVDVFNDYFGWKALSTKLFIYVLVGVLLILIVEPEKTESFANVTFYITIGISSRHLMSVVLFSYKCIERIVRGTEAPKWEQVPKWNMDGFQDYFGNVAYAFEVSSVYLSCSFCSSSATHFGEVHQIQTPDCRDVRVHRRAHLCHLQPLLIRRPGSPQAFSKDELGRRQTTFSLFENEIWLYRHSFLVYALAQIYLFLSNTMYVTELIETLDWVSKFVQKTLPSGEMVTSRPKLVTFRCTLWTTTVVLSLLSDQILKVLNFGGNVCSPLISVILPVLEA